MVIFLYSDIKYEQQAKYCIATLENKVADDTKIVYYTIGFKSNFQAKNLEVIYVPLKPEYPRFHFYKAQLSLLTMDLFPDDNYIFTDIDVLFSRRFDETKLTHNFDYPLASFGPHEYPFMYEYIDGNRIIYDVTKLMNYFNVSKRSQRYVWSCFYVFNPNCREFFEEYTSICRNKYLLDRQKIYLSFADEGAFNICLWKRNATENLGFAFVNTHLLNTVQYVEESKVTNKHMGNVVDNLGADWEYIDDTQNVLFYHGFNGDEETEQTVKYLTL